MKLIESIDRSVVRFTVVLLIVLLYLFSQVSPTWAAEDHGNAINVASCCNR